MSSALLVAIFAAGAGVIWLAGIQLSRATDALDDRLGLGSALGGLILLAFATNLPEIAITVAAAASNNLELAVGNLLGGIAIQTLVLAILDIRSTEKPLTRQVRSLVVVLEASIVVGALVAALMTTQLPATTEFAGVSPGTLAIVAVWLGGLAVINRARAGIPWRADVAAVGGRPSRANRARKRKPFSREGTAFIAGVFGMAALATLAGGVAVEETGTELADRIGLSGAVFGATILAAATALPELSTGLASVKLGEHELAFADIFGGNAFLPALFLVADLIAGTPALPGAQATDIWMAGLGILMTAVYIGGLVMRPERKLGPIGPDSWLVTIIYVLGVMGLIAVG